jgi:mannose-6-phosphate isomerase-like protein (cupin superfamily)
MSSDLQIQRVMKPNDGEILPWAVGTNRFVLDGSSTQGTIAVVEHRVEPHALPGPVHKHSREDEYSYVLEGRVTALFGDTEVVAEAGDLVIKPRGEWHTFWNATDEPLRILELIVPGGLEELFRRLSGGALDPASLPALAAEFGCEIDFERTMQLIERHGLHM